MQFGFSVTAVITTWPLHCKGVVIITHNRDSYLSVCSIGEPHTVAWHLAFPSHGDSSYKLCFSIYTKRLLCRFVGLGGAGKGGGRGCRSLLEVTSSDLSELLFSYFPLCLCEWLVLNDCPMESGRSKCSQLKSGEKPAAALSAHPEHAPPTLRLSFWLIPDEIKCPSAFTLLAA